MLQCGAVCCSVLQCELDRVGVGVVQCVAQCCRVLQCVAVCCSMLQCELDRVGVGVSSVAFHGHRHGSKAHTHSETTITQPHTHA